MQEGTITTTDGRSVGFAGFRRHGAHACHTAQVVPGATLRIFDPLGHFSIVREAVASITQMLARLDRAPMVSI
jgi:hypothetical protein